MARSLVSSDSMEFPIPYKSSIGFTVVTNTACLPLLRLLPPGINPFLKNGVQFIRFPDVIDVLGKSFRTQYCIAVQDQ